MPRALRHIETEAMGLDLENRAILAERLILSLDNPSETEIERLWIDEAERRLERYRQGKVRGIAGELVFKRAIAELS
mgnify:CR=1 FL=1